MAWPDDDGPPGAGRSELLARVERRGRELRLRRRAGLGAAAAVALLAVSVPTALLRDGAGGRGAVEVASTGDDVTTTAPEVTTVPLPELPAGPTSVPGAPVPTTAGTRPPRPPTSVPSPTVTTVAPAAQAPPAVPGAATTTTQPPPLQPRCGPAQIVVTATPDKPDFGPGERVGVATTARNRTAQPCYYVGYTAQVTFRDAAGRSWSGVILHADGIGDTALGPGETLTHRGEWDQNECPPAPGVCGRAAPGEYSATATWSFYSGAEATAPFRLVP